MIEGDRSAGGHRPGSGEHRASAGAGELRPGRMPGVAAGVVGVTGHRPPALAGVSHELLERRVDTVLGVLADLGHHHLVSGLAEGVDRIVARRALVAGWTIDALLPFESARYEADFDGRKSRAEFSELLAQSGTVTVAPQSATVTVAPQSSSAPAGVHWGASASPYAAQGKALVAGSHTLLAIWDGLPARGPGGTADVVGWARGAGVPVVWIHLRHPHRMVVLDAEKGTTALIADRNAGRAAATAADLRRRLASALDEGGG